MSLNIRYFTYIMFFFIIIALIMKKKHLQDCSTYILSRSFNAASSMCLFNYTSQLVFHNLDIYIIVTVWTLTLFFAS